MFATSLSSEAADVAALRFVDKNVEPGAQYIYILSSKVNMEQYIVDSGTTIAINVLFPEEAPIGLNGIGGERKIELHWDRNQKQNFDAFDIERSDDGGKTYRQINKTPYFSPYKLDSETPSDSFNLAMNSMLSMYQIYIDSVPENYKNYYYRIRGYDGFGGKGNFSDPMMAHAIDLTPPKSPFIDSIVNISQKAFKLYWKPNKEDKTIKIDENTEVEDKLNPFTLIDQILIVIVAVAGLTWIINDPISKISDFNLLRFGGVDVSSYTIIITLILFLYLLGSRIVRYSAVTRDKMFAVVIFAFFIIFFWASFEQAGGSMSIFAKDYTSRILSGNSAMIFNIVDVIITVVPIAIITWVLFLFFKQTFKKYLWANMVLGFSFVIIWGLIIWKVNTNFTTYSYEITYKTYQIKETNDKGEETVKDFAITAETTIPENAILIDNTTVIRSSNDFVQNDKIAIIDIDKKGTNYKYLTTEQASLINTNIEAVVVQKKDNEIQIPATWFLILNSLFIIAFAPLFSKWWESKYNPKPANKYAIGLFFLGIGFAFLAFGASGIPQGAKTASVSIVWLILAYLFHTLGELCVSPVGLSYVSKLVPARMIAFMFGVWYLALAIGNKTSGQMGAMIDVVTEKYDISTFFLIFTFVPVIIGLIALSLNPVLKKLMHGVK